MTAVLVEIPREKTAPLSASRAHAEFAGSLALAGFAGYAVVYLLRAGVMPVDFHMYRRAAEEIAVGESPYSWFAYPPLTALAVVPFTLLSAAAADFLVKALLILCVVAILMVLGVRDWRCYPVALLWPSVSHAVQTGNVTIPLALGAALLWRFRDRAAAGGVILGLSVAAKLVLWPLALWLAAAGRRIAAAWAVIAAAAATLATWAIVDFRALVGYPDRLQKLNEEQRGRGYTLDTFAVDLGAGATLARLVMLAVALALLVATVVVARRGNEARSFVLAIAAAVACSPIVWLHYFAFFLVPVAVARPRLGFVWFVPFAMWGFGVGIGNGSTGAAAVVLAVAAATIVLAFREAPSRDTRKQVVDRGDAATGRLVAARPR